jgi:hypothetical protein
VRSCRSGDGAELLELGEENVPVVVARQETVGPGGAAEEEVKRRADVVANRIAF